jgi:hypothetical protein
VIALNSTMSGTGAGIVQSLAQSQFIPEFFLKPVESTGGSGRKTFV